MLDHRLAARPHGFDELDPEQEDSDRNDEVAEVDRHLPVGPERNAEHRIGERHVQKKDRHVEEGKRDEQEGKTDQHGTWPSFSARKLANSLCRSPGYAEKQHQRDRSVRNISRDGQTSFFGLSTWRPRYMPVLRST
jgi:hypothetical protein